MQQYTDTKDFYLNHGSKAPALPLEDLHMTKHGLRVKGSPLHGRGVFATKKWPAHAILMQYPVDRIETKPLRNGFDLYLGYQEGKEYYAVTETATHAAHLINTSTVPNVSFVVCVVGKTRHEQKIIDKRVVFVTTLRPIKAGTELVVDNEESLCTDRMDLVLKALHPPPNLTDKKRDDGIPLLVYKNSKGKPCYLNVKWCSEITENQTAYSFSYVEEDPTVPEYFIAKQNKKRIGMWLVKQRSAPVSKKDGNRHKPMLGLVLCFLPNPNNALISKKIAQEGWKLLDKDTELCGGESALCRCGLGAGITHMPPTPEPHRYELPQRMKERLHEAKEKEKEEKRRSRSKSPEKEEKKRKSRSRSPVIYGDENKAKNHIRWLLNQYVIEIINSSKPKVIANMLRLDLEIDIFEVFDDYFDITDSK